MPDDERDSSGVDGAALGRGNIGCAISSPKSIRHGWPDHRSLRQSIVVPIRFLTDLLDHEIDEDPDLGRQEAVLQIHRSMLRQALDATALRSCCAIFILIGASFFSLPLRGMDGDVWIAQWFNQLPGGAASFMLVTNLLIFLLAFFLDFFEIAFIVLPLLMPVVRALGIDPAWFAVLVCLTLQTSFMHPPFGIAICNLRSVAPRTVKTSDIYRGAIPFLILQLGVVALLIVFPEFAISLR